MMCPRIRVNSRHATLTLLDTYEAERRPLAQRNTGYARHFADSVGLFSAKPELDDDSAQGNEERAKASEYLNRHARLEFNIPGVTFGGRYGDSPIIAQDGVDLPPDEPNDYVPTASPGGRPPHAWLEDGRSLYDTFHTEWTLLALGATDPATDGFKNAAQSMGIDLKVVRLPAQQLLELYESPLVLIRPDQIVAWRGASDEDGQQVLSLALGIHRIT